MGCETLVVVALKTIFRNYFLEPFLEKKKEKMSLKNQFFINASQVCSICSFLILGSSVLDSVVAEIYGVCSLCYTIPLR